MELLCPVQASGMNPSAIKVDVMNKSHEPQEVFPGVKRQASQPADQRTVEADVLQVLADINLDQRDQLRHVPGFHLVGDEGRYAAFLLGDHRAQDRDQTLVDLASQLGVGSERLSGLDE